MTDQFSCMSLAFQEVQSIISPVRLIQAPGHQAGVTLSAVQPPVSLDELRGEVLPRAQQDVDARAETNWVLQTPSI